MTLTFNGEGSNVVKFPSTSALELQKFTLAVWFNTTKNYVPDLVYGGEGMMIMKGGWITNKTGEQLSYGIWISDANHLRAGFETTQGTDNILTTSGTKVNTGTWRHGALTYDSATLKLYLDGVLFKQLATNALPEKNNIPLCVGKIALDRKKGYYKGKLDDIRVYNYALTDAEIQAIFKLRKGLVYSKA